MVDLKRAGKAISGGAALAAALNLDVDIDEEHGEVSTFRVAGVPLFRRDDRGRPRVLGIRFPRWIRGPRKEP